MAAGVGSHLSHRGQQSQSSRDSDLHKYPAALELVNQQDNVSVTNSLQDITLTPQKNARSTPQEGDANAPTQTTGDAEKFYEQNNLQSEDHTEDLSAIQDEEMHAPKWCKSCHGHCIQCWKPCMTKSNPLSENPSQLERLKYACMCPIHGQLAYCMALFLAVLFFWAVLWSLTGNSALPGGNFFAIIILLVGCVIGGLLIEKIKLPPLLGMLLMGCLLRNVPKINVAKDIQPEWSSAFRNIALVVILTRAGMGLDPVALRKLSGGVLCLAFIPCITETVTSAIASHYILGFPWIWGIMLGFVLGAVSPAVVVPSMLFLQINGWGVDKGIPTLVIAAASVDDVLAISGFGVALGITFSEGSIAMSLIKGPLEALAGIVYGVMFGVICWYIPHAKHDSRKLFRFILLFCGGLFAIFGSQAADLSGAGALGCLTLAFVTALNWRKEVTPDESAPVSDVFGKMWLIFQPLLFGLIGAEVDVTKIEPSTIGLGVAILIAGLSTRAIASFLAVSRLGFTLKEKLFIPFAWLPKATVQAAIGSVALDMARKKHASEEELHLGTQLLTIAVLAIMITAPIGSIAIALTAPRFLKKTTKTGHQPDIANRAKMDNTNANVNYDEEQEVTQHMV